MARFIAIDIESSGIFLTAGTASGQKVAVDSAVSDIDAIGELTAETAPRFAERIRTLMETGGISSAPALISIGRDKVIWKQVKYPPTAPAQEPSIIRFQAQKELPVPPESVVMDYLPADPPDANAPIRHASVLFINKDLLELLGRVCELAGLKLQAVIPRPYNMIAGLHALAKASAIPPLEPGQAVALLSLWSKGGEFTVLRDRELLFTRSISPMAYNSESAMAGELKRSIAAYDVIPGVRPIQTIYVCETEVAGWTARLQTALNPCSVQALDPLAGMPAASAVPVSQRGRYLAPLGLIATRTALEIPAPNFTAPRKPKIEPSTARKGLFLGAFAIVAILAGFWIVAFLQTRRMQSEIDALAAQQSTLKSKIAIHEVDAKRLAAAEFFKSRDLAWLDIFYDLNDQFPPNSRWRLKEFDGSVYYPPQQARGVAAPAAKGPTTPPAATPGTAAGNRPVFDPKDQRGTLKIVLVGESPTLPEKLKDQFNREKGYGNAKMTVGGTVGSGKDRLQEYTVEAALTQRKPTEFVRKLPAPPPPPKIEDPEAESEEWDDPPAVPMKPSDPNSNGDKKPDTTPDDKKPETTPGDKSRKRRRKANR